MNSICKKCKGDSVAHNNVYAYHDVHTCKSCGYIWLTRIDDCCRKPYSIVTSVGDPFSGYRLYHQCLNCGGANKSKPLKTKIYGDLMEAGFNQHRFDEWKALRVEENNQIFEGINYSNYTLTKRYKYLEYLASEEWKKKRVLVMERDNRTCQICKIASADDIHHLTYDNLFNEPLEDLLAICRSCHFNLHSPNNSNLLSAN